MNRGDAGNGQAKEFRTEAEARVRAITDPAVGRRARVATALLWWGVLASFIRSVVRTRDLAPDHLLSIAVLGYLAAWGPYLMLSRRGPAGKVARFAACTASIALALAVFETPAAVHLIDYRSVFHTPTPPWRREGNRPDAELLYVREPHQRLRVRFQGSDLHGLDGATPSKVYHCETLLDAQGFRNPSNLASAQVVVLGDSFVEGLQTSDDELITARLSEALDAPTANLGRTGYGPQQELEVLRRFGVALRPRTCVWAFYEGNDLQDVESYEETRDRVRKLRPDSATRDWFARSFVRNSSAYLIRRGTEAPGVPARLQAGRFLDASGRAIPIYFSCGVHEGAADRVKGRIDSPSFRRFRTILDEARAACRAQGIDLVVAFVPSKFRVYRDLCRFDDDSPCRDWPVDDLPAAVGRAVHETGEDVGFLDLTPALRDRAAEGALVYLADDTHWSGEGHRTAALALAAFLERREPARPAASLAVGDYLDEPAAF